MIMSIAGLVVAANLVVPVAGGVPEFNLQQSCHGVQVNLNEGRNRDSCLHDERDARDELKKNWSSFSINDRGRCTSMATLGGLPSYVELLTCLQISKQAKELSEDTPAKKIRP